MMRTRTSNLLVGLCMMLATACSSATPQTAAPSASGPAPAPQRTAVILTHVEPISLSEHRALYTTGSNPVDAKRLFNASLYLADYQGIAQPYLAERKPELNTDTWRVFPDGRMETTYTLRPGLTWHDGAPFTTQDMVLSWRMAKHPDFGVSGLIPMK